MTRKYLCDICGEDVKDIRHLYELKVTINKFDMVSPIGEYCKNCMELIEKIISDMKKFGKDYELLIQARILHRPVSLREKVNSV